MSNTVNEYLRAVVILVALAAAIALAFLNHNDVAVGAVLAAMSAGIGYLFPGGKQPSA